MYIKKSSVVSAIKTFEMKYIKQQFDYLCMNLYDFNVLISNDKNNGNEVVTFEMFYDYLEHWMISILSLLTYRKRKRKRKRQRKIQKERERGRFLQRSIAQTHLFYNFLFSLFPYTKEAQRRRPTQRNEFQRERENCSL